MPRCTLELDDLRVIADPAAGACLRRFDLRSPAGAWTPLLRPMPDASMNRSDAACFLMLPWIGRIPGGVFAFDGVEHRLHCDTTGTSGATFAIHGDVKSRPWTITDRSPVSARFVYDSRAHAESNWPWPYAACARYALGPSELRAELSIRNLAEVAFPIGGGFHPYFQRRLWGERTDASCVVRAPATARYALVGGVANATPAGDALCAALRHGTTLDEPTDDVFTTAGPCELRWDSSGLRVTIEPDASLTHAVVWAPHDPDPSAPGGSRPRSFVCVEPVSTTTDAFNLADRGVPGTGVRVLQPGTEHIFTMTIRTSRTGSR